MSGQLDENKQFETKLTLLQEILDKKMAALTAILNISENQENLYLSPPSETRREFLLEMGKQKQKQIDEVLTCDEVFQRLFDSIAPHFEQNSKNYRESIQKLQNSIKAVIETDVKIRAQEEKSKSIAKGSFGLPASKESNINPANTGYILSQYRSHNKPPQDKK